jgi:hypothetical protein
VDVPAALVAVPAPPDVAAQASAAHPTSAPAGAGGVDEPAREHDPLVA